MPSTGEHSKQLALNLSRIWSLRILAATGTGHRRLGRDTEAAHPANLNHYSTWCSPALVCTFRFNTGGATSGRIRCCSFGRINECKLQVWLLFPTCIRSADINTDVALQSDYTKMMVWTHGVSCADTPPRHSRAGEIPETEVDVFTWKPSALNLQHQHSRGLFVLLSNCRRNTETLRWESMQGLHVSKLTSASLFYTFLSFLFCNLLQRSVLVQKKNK